MSEARNVGFPITKWSLVSRLRSPDPEVASRALNDLITQYHYRFTRSSGGAGFRITMRKTPFTIFLSAS